MGHVLAEPRKNRPPVAIVSPQFQEISLPTTSTVIDGSREYLSRHDVLEEPSLCTGRRFGANSVCILFRPVLLAMLGEDQPSEAID